MISVSAPTNCMADAVSAKDSPEHRLIEVEVAVAWPEVQVSVSLQLPQGATVADAISASGLAERFPELEISPDRLGVFAELRRPEDVLKPGDRVEIYRPLKADPKEIRREMARRKSPSGKK